MQKHEQDRINQNIKAGRHVNPGKKRTLWWQCSKGCTHTIMGHAGHSRETLRKLLTQIQKYHYRYHPLCDADFVRVAAKKSDIETNSGAVTFSLKDDPEMFDKPIAPTDVKLSMSPDAMRSLQ